MKNARLLPIFLAGATLLVSASAHYRWTRQQHQLKELFDRVEFAEELGVGRISVRKANDVPTAKARAIRTLLASQLVLPATRDLSTEERIALRDKSKLAVEELNTLSRQAWQSEPGSWVAAMGVGASEFLSGLRSKQGIQRLERERWLGPLTEAQTLAPGRGEVEGYLALALLEVWGDLSSEERERATVTLRQAMNSATIRNAILPRWTRLQHSYDDLVSVLPDLPAAWQPVYQTLARAGQWSNAVKTKTTMRQLSLQASEQHLARATLLLNGQEYFKAIDEFARSLAITPDNTNLPQVVAILRALPPGPVHKNLLHALKPWLAWANRQCVLTVCPVPTDVMTRLAGVVSYGHPDRGTALALINHQPDEAALSSEDWGLHWLSLTQSTSDAQTRARYTAKVDGKWRQTAAFAIARKKAGIPSSPPPQDWNPADWIRSPLRAYLSVVTTEASVLEVDINSSPRGGIGTLWLDGDWVAFPIVRGHITLDLELGPGNHVVEFETDQPSEVTPGSARLRPAS